MSLKKAVKKATGQVTGAVNKAANQVSQSPVVNNSVTNYAAQPFRDLRPLVQNPKKAIRENPTGLLNVMGAGLGHMVGGQGVGALAYPATGGAMDSVTGNELTNRSQRYQEEQALNAEQKAREAQASDVLAAFGEGGSSTAAANKAALDRSRRLLWLTTAGQGTAAAEQAYTAQERQNRINLARTGQLGAGLDSATQEQSLGQLFSGRQNAQLQADQTADQWGNAVTAERRRLYDAALSGGYDPQALSQARQSMYGWQQAASPGGAAGNIFGQLAGAAGDLGSEAIAANALAKPKAKSVKDKAAGTYA